MNIKSHLILPVHSVDASKSSFANAVLDDIADTIQSQLGTSGQAELSLRLCLPMLQEYDQRPEIL